MAQVYVDAKWVDRKHVVKLVECKLVTNEFDRNIYEMVIESASPLQVGEEYVIVKNLMDDEEEE